MTLIPMILTAAIYHCVFAISTHLSMITLGQYLLSCHYGSYTIMYLDSNWTMPCYKSLTYFAICE